MAIDTAMDGAEGLAAVRKISDSGSSYALIIMDLAMPVLDGLSACEQVRLHMYHGTTIPIIAVSSFGELKSSVIKYRDFFY